MISPVRPCVGWSLIVAAVGAMLLPITAAEAQRRGRRGGVDPAEVARLQEVLKVGQTAKDVEFVPLIAKKGEEQAKVKLSELTKEGPVVLVVLRGYPGYQCPLCMRQVAELRSKAADFVKLGAKVVLVYPGAGQIDPLEQLAHEFLVETKVPELPEPFVMMVDPDYAFTKLYELRWDAPRETAYPSTFVLDPKRVVLYRKISTTHGDRAPTKDVLATLEKWRRETTTTAAESRPDTGE